MAKELVTFSPDMDLHQAIKMLLAKRISGAPVVDDQGGLVGILSKKDCLKVAFAASYHKELAGPVADYMSTSVETVDADDDIVEVAELFLRSTYRRFPVMERGRLVSQISRHDILQAIEDLW
ncbi:MAG: CBS domain-containing protein [Alphaproteobacteria bacterium]|jgi:CBS domain-containing protein|nr:CBS domain-containing protein [Alphaproteobacteria bacterium]